MKEQTKKKLMPNQNFQRKNKTKCFYKIMLTLKTLIRIKIYNIRRCVYDASMDLPLSSPPHKNKMIDESKSEIHVKCNSFST